MQKIEIPEKIPHELLTIGGVHASETPVKATCLRCGVDQKVDIKAILEDPRFGPEGTFVNGQGGCRIYTCPGRVYFQYWSRGHDMWMPFFTRTFSRQVLDARRPTNPQP